MFKTIHKLSQEVIDKIAAGEIAQNPTQVAKELIENSIDAGSTKITLSYQQSGMQLLQIQDNGKGVCIEDFALLCERFATSKITTLSDLQSVNSFGFRGEALSSVSHVSHLTIRSKQRQCDIGYVGEFRNGQLINPPQMEQMEDGTAVCVANLFYNLPQRQVGVLHAEERKSLLLLLQSFAVHHCKIAFKVLNLNNKLGCQIEFSSDGSGDSNQILQTMLPNTKYSDFLQFTMKACDNQYQIGCCGTCSKLGVNIRKNQRHIFVFLNDRQVTSVSLKRAIGTAYNSCFQSIHDDNGYVVHLAIQMPSQNVDVNVHPSKKVVKYVYESEIESLIQKQVELVLKQGCGIKICEVNSLKQQRLNFNNFNSNANTNINEAQIQKQKQIYDKNLVRVDPTIQKIDTFYKPIKQNCTVQEEEDQESNIIVKMDEIQDPIVAQLIMELKQSSQYSDATRFFHSLSYTGCISSNYLIAQKDQQLLLVNAVPMSLEVFYQYCLLNYNKFNRHSIIQMQGQEGFDLIEGFRDVLTVSYTEYSFEQKQLIISKALECLDLLKVRQQLLAFGIDIEQDNNADNIIQKTDDRKTHYSRLMSFPKMFELPQPTLRSLAQFILKVSHEISDWEFEFEQKKTNLTLICKWVAELYADQMQCEKIYCEKRQQIYHDIFDLQVFPFLKKKCFFTFPDLNFCVTKLLTLEDVYKVFERC